MKLDKNTKILIYKVHIISQITKLFINIECLREKIYPAFMMPLISEPLNNTLIHRLEVTIIPNQRNFINKYTRLFRKPYIEYLFRLFDVKCAGKLFSCINVPTTFPILIRKFSK